MLAFLISLLPRVLYSLVLAALAGVLLREVWTVWFDNRIYIGRFPVIGESSVDEAKSAAFPTRIISAQTMLVNQLKDYLDRRSPDSPTDITYPTAERDSLRLSEAVLDGIEITVQQVNVTQILTRMRRMFLAPNEIRGQISIEGDVVLGSVEWPRAGRLADSLGLSNFLIPNSASEQEAARYVACSVLWAQGARQNSTIAKRPRGQFCDLAVGLADLYALSPKASSPAGLDANEAKRVRVHVAALRAHEADATMLPELYRLRADLLDLLPEAQRKIDDLVEAQEARLSYAMLSPSLAKLQPDQLRLAAAALARPALLLSDGELKAVSDNWKELLKPHTAAIKAASAATGIIITGKNQPVGTGVIVAPGQMMTANFALRYARQTSTSENPARLCLGAASASSCSNPLVIGETVFDSGDRSGIALARVENYDPASVSPLRLFGELPAADELTGRYVFVVGYPFADLRMPSFFQERLLSNHAGMMHLMPGRILAFGRQDNPGHDPTVRQFTTDVSTSGGVAGAALVDLTSGHVVGMHFAGLWLGERGKFAYSLEIPRPAVEKIEEAIRAYSGATAEPIAQPVPSPADRISTPAK
jgi:hypothetical protein